MTLDEIGNGYNGSNGIHGATITFRNPDRAGAGSYDQFRHTVYRNRRSPARSGNGGPGNRVPNKGVIVTAQVGTIVLAGSILDSATASAVIGGVFLTANTLINFMLVTRNNRPPRRRRKREGKR